jgi:hypothetical protein
MAIMTTPAMIARLLFASAISFTFRLRASRGEGRVTRFVPGEKHSILPVSKWLNMLVATWKSDKRTSSGKFA